MTKKFTILSFGLSLIFSSFNINGLGQDEGQLGILDSNISRIESRALMSNVPRSGITFQVFIKLMHQDDVDEKVHVESRNLREKLVSENQLIDVEAYLFSDPYQNGEIPFYLRYECDHNVDEFDIEYPTIFIYAKNQKFVNSLDETLSIEALKVEKHCLNSDGFFGEIRKNDGTCVTDRKKLQSIYPKLKRLAEESLEVDPDIQYLVDENTYLLDRVDSLTEQNSALESRVSALENSIKKFTPPKPKSEGLTSQAIGGSIFYDFHFLSRTDFVSDVGIRDESIESGGLGIQFEYSEELTDKNIRWSTGIVYGYNWHNLKYASFSESFDALDPDGESYEHRVYARGFEERVELNFLQIPISFMKTIDLQHPDYNVFVQPYMSILFNYVHGARNGFIGGTISHRGKYKGIAEEIQNVEILGFEEDLKMHNNQGILDINRIFLGVRVGLDILFSLNTNEDLFFKGGIYATSYADMLRNQSYDDSITSYEFTSTTYHLNSLRLNPMGLSIGFMYNLK